MRTWIPSYRLLILALPVAAAMGLALASVLPRGLVEVHSGEAEVTVYLDSSDRRYGFYAGDRGWEWTAEGGFGYFSCNQTLPVNCPFLVADENNE